MQQILNISLQELTLPNETPPSEIDIDIVLDKFIQKIREAADSSIPKTKRTKRTQMKNVPWWNKEFLKN